MMREAGGGETPAPQFGSAVGGGNRFIGDASVVPVVRPEAAAEDGGDAGASDGALGRLRHVADRTAGELQELQETYGPEDVVDARHVAALAEQAAVLEQQLTVLAAANAEQIAFMQQLAREIATLRAGLATVSDQARPITRTTFEIIGRGVLFATVGAIVGATLGGPAAAMVLHEPVSGKVLEGAITGALGAAAAEVGRLLDPIDGPEPRIGTAADKGIAGQEEQRARQPERGRIRRKTM